MLSWLVWSMLLLLPSFHSIMMRACVFVFEVCVDFTLPYDIFFCTVAVDCPANSAGTVPGDAGTGGSSGCIVNAGYSGSVTATSTAPFYAEDITGTL